MRIQKLHKHFLGQAVYVVGTGPSLRVTPLDFLKGKPCIGLNQAYKYLPLSYSITVHPELVLEYQQAKNPNLTAWIVKRKAPMANLSFDDKNYYVFETGQDDFDLLRKRTPDKLFLAKGIQCTAMDMAARMGASTIILVGVDMGSLAGDHHGHDQHVRFLGVDPDLVYKEYRHHTAKVRKVLRDEFKINVLTLGPFLGATASQEDYLRLSEELKLSRLPAPPDISNYSRPAPRLE